MHPASPAASICVALWFILAPPLHGQEEPRHTFQPVKSEWTPREGWLRLPQDPAVTPKPKDGMVTFRRDGLVYLSPEERSPRDRDCWREIRYFDGQRITKTLLYDPENRLRMEVDDLGREQFTRQLRPDGSIASYSHVKDWRSVDGFSTSADGWTIARVVDGTGQLVQPGYRAGDWLHHWIHNGRGYLSKEYRGGHCIWIALGVKADSLTVRPGDEMLTLGAECEDWSRENGKAPVVTMSEWYINGEDGSLHRREVPPKTDIRPLPEGGYNQRGNTENRDQKIREEWAQAYPKRRAAFIAAYTEALRETGESWSSLGIDFIRSEGAWPSAGTTRLPRLGGRKIAPYRCSIDLHSGKVALDRPKDLEKDEEVAWDNLSNRLSHDGHTFRIVIEDDHESRKNGGFPTWARVSVTEVDDKSKKDIRTIPVQEFLGEHEEHGCRALILKDGKLRFWMQFWVND